MKCQRDRGTVQYGLALGTRLLPVLITLCAFSRASLVRMEAQRKEPLRLIQSILLPNLKGRIDHSQLHQHQPAGRRSFSAPPLPTLLLEMPSLKPGKCLVALPKTEISLHKGRSWSIVSLLPPLQFINQAKSFRATPALRICPDQRADDGGTTAGESF